MFDYLLKQFAGKQKTSKHQNEDRTEVKKPVSQAAKEEALIQAEQLSGEDEALAFLLQSPFADARYIAVQRIYSKAMLEKVRAAMRNTDRRVVRLAQTLLDEMNRKDDHQRKARECIEDAKKLAKDNLVTPNLVADLDRRWEPLTYADGINDAIRGEFDVVRQEVGNRLTEQTEIQRTVMGWVDNLERIKSEQDVMTPDERAEQLAQMEEQMQRCLVSREASSIPRHLLISFEQLFQELKGKSVVHQQHYDAYIEREKLLHEWEETPKLNALLIQKQWDSLPKLTGPRMIEMQDRFNVLLQRTEPDFSKQAAPSVSSAFSDAPEAPKERKAQFDSALLALEQAVQDGAVQQAIQHDDVISNLMTPAWQVSGGDIERLNVARSAMKHLQGWARWSGQIAYDELIREVEDLPQQELPIDELANTIVELRKKWKVLNVTSGMALKNQWQKFHDACNHAYEPVLNHARQTAEKRDQSIVEAQAIIANVREYMTNAGFSLPEDSNDSADDSADGNQDIESLDDQPGLTWKNLAAFHRNTMNSWRQLGQINRKERKQLDAEFDALIHPLRECLNQRTEKEINFRESLIDKVSEINPEDRNAGRILRELQDRWQEKARRFPLENRDDQKLWQRFRAACEAVHTQRMKVNEGANEERQRNLELKEAVCSLLEKEQQLDLTDMMELLRHAEESWKAIGVVPKAAESTILNRYLQAREKVQTRIQETKDNKKQLHIQEFIDKLALCQEMEMNIGQTKEASDWIARWEALPPLEGKLENSLRNRWEAGIKALIDDDPQYIALLQENKAVFLEKILRLEIMMGQDSPPEFAQQRLKVQVEVLQESLSGIQAIPQKKLLEALCQMPAKIDESSAARLLKLLKK